MSKALLTRRISPGCVALTEVSQQKLRRLFFRQPTDKIVLLRTIHHRVDNDTALCVSSVLTGTQTLLCQRLDQDYLHAFR